MPSAPPTASAPTQTPTGPTAPPPTGPGVRTVPSDLLMPPDLVQEPTGTSKTPLIVGGIVVGVIAFGAIIYAATRKKE
jgi:hypothetical protein